MSRAILIQNEPTIKQINSVIDENLVLFIPLENGQYDIGFRNLRGEYEQRAISHKKIINYLNRSTTIDDTELNLILSTLRITINSVNHTVNITDEFFIAIAHHGVKNRLHSFLMLGVIHDGKPQLLGRFSKGFRINVQKTPYFMMPYHIFDMELHNEGISREESNEAEIYYSAYSISYPQYLDFVRLIDAVNQQQTIDRAQSDHRYCALNVSEEALSSPAWQTPISPFNRGFVRVQSKTNPPGQLYYIDTRAPSVTPIQLTNEALTAYDSQVIYNGTKPTPFSETDIRKLIPPIYHRLLLSDETWYHQRCTIPLYKPIKTTDDKIELAYTTKPLRPNEQVNLAEQPVYQRSQTFSYLNTCRHTVIELLNFVRGSITSISTYWFLPLKLTLKAGQFSPNQNIYIMPIPPQMDMPNHPDVIKKQLILTKLYQRLERLILINPDSQETKAKFDLLKQRYLDTHGEINLPLNQILTSILNYQKTHQTALFKQREQRFIDHFYRLFGSQRKTATEHMFDEFQDMQNESRPKRP